MSLNTWYDKGLQPDEYMARLEKHKDNFHHIYNHFKPPADEDFFKSAREKNLRVVALAEVWCGHCMLDIPILLRIAEKADISVRFLPRDENLELMDQYLTNGNRVIPIFIFIDKDGNEVGKWGPIAESVREFVSQYREKLPSKDADDYEEKFREMVKITSKAFRESESIWNNVYESIKETIDNI